MSALVGVIMGSKSDWSTLSHTADMLEKLGIPYEVKVVSAHRTPDLLFQYADEAESRGIEVIIAGAGGAAHLPGMCAAKTHLPVLGVPVQSSMLSGVDSLLSIVQMPAGIPVATLAIGKAGAINAALLSASILGAKHPQFHAALKNSVPSRQTASWTIQTHASPEVVDDENRCNRWRPVGPYAGPGGHPAGDELRFPGSGAGRLCCGAG